MAELKTAGKPSINLKQLDPRIQPLAEELIRRATRDLRFEIRIVDVLRTPAEQERNIKNNVSWTKNSLHLPQPDCGKSHAIDIVPMHLAILKNWAPGHPDWTRLGQLGESLGFSWGGRWKQKDCPHFEIGPLKLAGISGDVPKEATA